MNRCLPYCIIINERWEHTFKIRNNVHKKDQFKYVVQVACSTEEAASLCLVYHYDILT